MLSNEQMKENRYGRWAKARKLYGKIQATFAAGGIVTVATATRATHYNAKHSEMFRVTRTGVYIQRGKSWDCIDLCGFRFSIPA
jgi:hypothetical protein